MPETGSDRHSVPDGIRDEGNAGIQSLQLVMDSGFHRGDGNWGLLRFRLHRLLILFEILIL
jgi:hypothetical protein